MDSPASDHFCLYHGPHLIVSSNSNIVRAAAFTADIARTITDTFRMAHEERILYGRCRRNAGKQHEDIPRKRKYGKEKTGFFRSCFFFVCSWDWQAQPQFTICMLRSNILMPKLTHMSRVTTGIHGRLKKGRQELLCIFNSCAPGTEW